MKIVAFFLSLFSGFAFAAEVRITSDCVYLDDAYEGYPHISIQCGIKSGEKKVIPSQSIATALKRAGVRFDSPPPAFTAERDGGIVSEKNVMEDIQRLYSAQYPEYEIRVEYVRFGREIFSDNPYAYEISIDTGKLGSANGTIMTNGGRFSFSYMVKAFAEVRIAKERINAGEDLIKKSENKYLDITALRSTPLLELNKLVAKKTIQKGKIITAELTEPKPDRVKGEPIRLIYQNGELVIEINAIADGDAVEGKTFPVMNPVTGKTVTAKYLGNGTAKIY
jgi:flagella basal body P-ring formation protein FlgA